MPLTNVKQYFISKIETLLPAFCRVFCLPVKIEGRLSICCTLIVPSLLKTRPNSVKNQRKTIINTSQSSKHRNHESWTQIKKQTSCDDNQ